MNFSGLTLDLDIEDPVIEELIQDFFPEKIGKYNYDIRNKAIICYEDMITRSNRYETSPQEESQNSMKSFFTTTTAESSNSSQSKKMSIENLIVYAEDNNLKWLERDTPVTERTQEIIIAGRAHRYTINNTYYLFDSPNKCFYKMYKFDSNIVSILSIVREIVLHNYAVFLNSKCINSSKKNTHRITSRITTVSSFHNKVGTHKTMTKTLKIKRFHLKKPYTYLNKIKIPKLENYFFNYAEDNTEIILKYELLNIVFPKSGMFLSRRTIDLKAAITSEWEYFFTKIVDLLTCFESNGLFHNDSHRDNLCFVRISNQTYSLAIIDFGKATLSVPVHSSLMGFIKPKIDSSKNDRKQNFLNWIDRVATSDTRWDDNIRYGGYKKETLK